MTHWYMSLQKSTARLEKRWQAGLAAAGTWPEVLRRYVLTRTSKGLVDPDIKRSAGGATFMFFPRAYEICIHFLNSR